MPEFEPVKRVFGLFDQTAFARLSGDRNPMHVDPVQARRMLFGAPVVHGVHLVMWALERLCLGLNGPHRLDALKAGFEKPVLVEDEALLEITTDGEGRYRASVRVRGKIAARVTATISAGDWAGAAAGDGEPQCDLCDPKVEDLADMSGAIPLEISREALARQFPAISAILPRGQIAVLLACTRLVGMECPGLHSIFSALNLRFSDSTAQARSLTYRTKSVDFSLVQMELGCAGLKGEAAAFVRPAVRDQSAFAEMARLVAPGRFADVNALIVGGSRGLGEATANLIAAGGGQVAVTYHLGEDDAGRVARAIRNGGGRASTLRYDVRAAPPEAKPDAPYTHCFYYASPKISASSGGFDEALFAEFCRYYLTGALACLDWFAGRSANAGVFVYPSTVYIEAPPAGLAEYAAAKAAGEIACREAIRRHKKMKLFAPRLSRLATDQTVSLRGEEAGDTAMAMASLLNEIAPPKG